MSRPARCALAIVLLALLASCGAESDPPTKAAPTPTSSANHRGDIEVLDAVLVMNDDGSATLSARIVNHTDRARALGGVTTRDADYDTYPIRFFSGMHQSAIEPGAKATIGGTHDPVRIRIARGVEPGTRVPLSFRFDLIDAYDELPETSLKVPVVARSARYDAVAGNKPNTEIKVVDAKIVVVRGQEKAYVGGATTGSITDTAWELPTATDAKGNPVAYRHHTATGGPYGWLVEAGKTIPFGGPPWVVPEDEPQGDADYFNAKDVKVGETITVTIPFQSGDVVAPFKVVAG